ncbi:MAG: GGDEF domain-containing response regulator, partial [Planctomycetes bacterium]|nr:GGDEF domain-containing response regulator [Planctomycetota bacterium]
MSTPKTHRILLIDDNPAIHEDFKRILASTDQGGSESLSSARSAFFGEEQADTGPAYNYRLDSAFQGQQALEML